MSNWWLSWFDVNFFQWLSQPIVRAGGAGLTALLLMLWWCPKFIAYLIRIQQSQPVRADGPQRHLESKVGTPTMGGLLMLLSLSVSLLIWGDLSQPVLGLVWGVTLAFGGIGAADDLRKILRKNSKGLSAKEKYCWQSLVSILAIGLVYHQLPNAISTHLWIPLHAHFASLGWWFLPFAYFVVVGSSNAVNLTDGLDGLAIFPVVMVAMALGILASWFNAETGSGLTTGWFLPELTVFCAALMGAGLGFLWFNAYPAKIFMGDVGSLGLGAALGMTSVLLGQELLLLLMGGLFVLETVSVILQVGSFKLRKKRIFKMAPLHHHFELQGWSEPKVILGGWLLTFSLVLVGLFLSLS